MNKELETLEPSVVLKFVDGLLKRYEGKTDYNIYITKEWLLEIKQALDRLESIDNAEPSKALKCLDRIDNTLCLNNIKNKLEFGIDTEEHTDCDSVIGMIEDIATIKQALIQAEQDKKKLNKIEKLTHLLYSKRRKIGQEYVKWCKKNNTVFNDETNMITWVLAIKLKEVLNSE